MSEAPVSLADCFARAKKISESVGISTENVRLQQARYRAEVGTVLPQIDWIKEQFYQDAGGRAGGGNPLQTQPLSYFQIQQPIFAGFRDWRAVDIIKSQVRQAHLNERSTDLRLLLDVANAYYTAYTLQEQLSVYQEIRKLNTNQIDQLSRWVNLGRSRPSELLSAQTQMASLDAEIEDLKRAQAEVRHLLFFLTGVGPETPLMDTPPTASNLTLDRALANASQRPEILWASRWSGASARK